MLGDHRRPFRDTDYSQGVRHTTSAVNTRWFASPVYADGEVILVCDQDTDAFIIAGERLDLTCQPKIAATKIAGDVHLSGWTPSDDTEEQVELRAFAEVFSATHENHEKKLSEIEIPKP